MSGTLSPVSDQPACTLGASADGKARVSFPRLILYCPCTAKNAKFMPSYSLCPTERGKNRVELAEINTGNPLDEMASVYAMTSMIMANYSLTPGIPTDKSLMDLMDAKNKVMKDNNAGTKGCNTCHDDGNPKTLNDLLLAKPISPFSTKSPNVRRFKGG